MRAPGWPIAGLRDRRVLAVLGVAVLLGVGLTLSAISVLAARGEAESARANLAEGLHDLQKGRIRAARHPVAAARSHVEEADGSVNGLAGDVLAWVPVVGGAVRDAQHLVTALDDATAIAEIGVEIYPRVLGPKADLVAGEAVDLGILDTVLGRANQVGGLAHHAVDELEQVEGDTPLLGRSLTAGRDAALAEVRPLADGYDKARPALEVLPRMLGQDSEAKYLIAVLNPSELRYSGGAALALSPMRVDDGVATFRDIGSFPELRRANRLIYWKKVPGNPFHPRGRTRLQNATWSPYWSVSGEELLRAWAKVAIKRFDAVIAIDVVALARLVEATGPVRSRGYGVLTADNAVEKLVGSYDDYADENARRRLNQALLPVFRRAFFTGGNFLDKIRLLGEASAGRHLAIYHRDPGLQAALQDLGVDGDLSDTTFDYVGVFSQNVNIAKVDYWQRRAVSSDVTLDADGSAQVELTVRIVNDTSPYPYPSPDPRRGSYETRWSRLSLATFLPRGARIRHTSWNGTPFKPWLRTANDRMFLTRTETLPPGASGTLRVSYRVPRAADVSGDRLTYRLAVDPQGMVNPQRLSVALRLPRGWEVTSLPAGWKGEGDTVRLRDYALVDSPRWAITAARSD